jgi:putative redox protein
MTYTSLVTYLGELRTEAIHQKSNSVILTDAPIDNNGKGQLFSPTDLTATSLANCMLTVMSINAKSEGISFERIKAKVTKTMTSNPRKISEINIIIEISHDWDDKTKKRMEHTALNCPVALSLNSSIQQNVQFIYN